MSVTIRKAHALAVLGVADGIHTRKAHALAVIAPNEPWIAVRKAHALVVLQEGEDEPPPPTVRPVPRVQLIGW